MIPPRILTGPNLGEIADSQQLQDQTLQQSDHKIFIRMTVLTLISLAVLVQLATGRDQSELILHNTQHQCMIKYLHV